MGREEDQLGPSEFFTGAVALVKRKVKVLKIVQDAVFANLTLQFPATPASAGAVVLPAGISALTFPAFFELRDVKSFQLTSGSIQCIYDYGLPDPPP
jgi:hypothetical protein